MTAVSESYELLEPDTVPGYIAARDDLAARVDTTTLDVTEIGDGNLNLVFLCQDGDGRGIVLKQALPYVRLVGPSWPFTPYRAVAEARAYAEHGQWAAEYIPELYAFDQERFILAIEDLSDHRVWRGALTDGERHDGAAGRMGRYVGRVAFHTSVFGVEAKELKARAAAAISPDLCEITEDLVLTEPFSGAERNWYQDELEDAAASLREPDVLAAAGELKHAFMTRAEALIHGDLHTGSVMVHPGGSTRAFDGEFCFYGPVGFDLGDGIAYHVWLYLQPSVALALIIGAVASTPYLAQVGARVLAHAARVREASGATLPPLEGWATAAALYVVFALSVMSVAAGGYNPFIYFRF